MTVNCRLCGAKVDPQHGPVRLNENGLPVAATVDKEIALPLIDPAQGRNWKILLDGVEQDGVVAFDCEAGQLWRFQLDGAGRPIIRNTRILVEQLTGAVTIEWRRA